MASTHTPLGSHYVFVHMYMCGEWTVHEMSTGGDGGGGLMAAATAAAV